MSFEKEMEKETELAKIFFIRQFANNEKISKSENRTDVLANLVSEFGEKNYGFHSDSWEMECFKSYVHVPKMNGHELKYSLYGWDWIANIILEHLQNRNIKFEQLRLF